MIADAPSLQPGGSEPANEGTPQEWLVLATDRMVKRVSEQHASIYALGWDGRPARKKGEPWATFPDRPSALAFLVEVATALDHFSWTYTPFRVA